MPKFMVTVVQKFERRATLFVEAADDLEATDKVDRMDSDDFKWSNLDQRLDRGSNDVEIEDVKEVE